MSVVSGETATDQPHSLKGLSIDEDKSNAWISKCFAYSHSQALTCAPVISGSFVRLEYGLYSKVYSRSFAEVRGHTSAVNVLAALLGKVGSRGLHTLAPCSAPTSVFDIVPSYGILALNSMYTGGGGESTIDNLVRDLQHANSLLPRDQQCTIKSAVVTLNVMGRKALHPVRTSSSNADDIGSNDDDRDFDGNSSDYDENALYDIHGDRVSPCDVLIRSNQLFGDSSRFIGLTLGNHIYLVFRDLI